MAYRRAALFAFLHLLLVNRAAGLKCTHPKIMTEQTNQVDAELGSSDAAGYILVWDGNDLCNGTSAPDGCASIGKAYGTCITLSAKNLADPNATLQNRDYVDSLVFPDGSTLVTRGINFAGDGDPVVLGGTGCYHGAQGYAKLTYNEEENSYTYDLTTIELQLLDEDE
jgi:hypothetical protein